MARRTFFCCIKIIALALGVVAQIPALHAQSTAAPPSLQEQLEAQYPLAKMTAQGGCTVTNPDTALSIQQAGIGALPQKASSAMCAAHYRNGSITKPGFRCTYFLTATKQTQVNLEKGDKVFPTKIEVANNEVRVSFGYCSGDQGQAAAYIGQVVIEFPKDSLKSASVTQVEDKLNEVFSSDSGGQQQQAQSGPVPAQQSANQAQPQDNQDQSPACNVELGQTVAQVETACGKPASQAKGAAKLLYFYNQPKLKITFIGGKVADID